MAGRQVKLQGHLKKLVEIYKKETPGVIESLGIGSSIAQSIDDNITQQLDDIRKRLEALEQNKGFVDISETLQGLAVKLVNDYTNLLQNAMREGMKGVTPDLTPVKRQMFQNVSKIFDEIAADMMESVDDTRLRQMGRQQTAENLTSVPGYKRLQSWVRNGQNSNAEQVFNTRDDFDKELRENAKLRAASLNAAYYGYIEAFETELNNAKKVPVFEDYLDKETTLYRGADPNERYKPGSFAEFTPYYDTAARFAQSRKGGVIYAITVKPGQTGGVPGFFDAEQGQELGTMVPVELFTDASTGLSNAAIVAKNIDGKVKEVSSAFEKVEFASEEYLKTIEHSVDQVAKAYSDEDLEKLDLEKMNSKAFKEVAKRFPFLNQIVPGDRDFNGNYMLSGVDAEGIAQIEKITKKGNRFDGDLSIDKDGEGYVSLTYLNNLLTAAEKTKKAISEIPSPDVSKTVNSQKKAKETIDETTESLEKQTEVESKPSDVSTAKQVQAQQELKKATEATNESLKEQATVSSPVPSIKTEQKMTEEPALIEVEIPAVAEEVIDLQKEIEEATEESNKALHEQQTIVNKDVTPAEVVSDQTIQKEKEIAQAAETVVDTLREQASVAQQTDSAKAQTILKEETQQANQEVQKLVELLKEAKTVSRQTTKAQKKETNLAPATQEEELENLIRLLKEYYDLSNKAFKSTGNVKQAYSNELARLDSLIAQADPELRSQALTDIRVSVPKAKYDDAVAAQTAKELDEAERAAAELQRQTEQSRLEAEKLYETYLDAVSELNRLNMRNNLAMATEQDNKALQENVDRQNEIVISLRRRIEAQRELLNLSDADIQSDISSRVITSEKQQEYFNREYFQSTVDYETAFENYYKSFRQLQEAHEKGLDNVSILKMEESVERLSKSLDQAKAKLDALTQYAGNNQINLDINRQTVDNLINAYRTQDSTQYSRLADAFSEQSADKIERYNQELSKLRQLIASLNAVELDDNLGFSEAATEAARLNGEISQLVKELGRSKFARNTKNGTWLMDTTDRDVLSSTSRVEDLVNRYSELNNSMKSIQKISLGKDFKTANVEILTQDGNLRKLKLTYDEAEGSLRSLVMSEQHYVTVGEQFGQVLNNKIMQMAAYAATAVSMYEIIDVARMGTQYVTEFDAALKELQLASNASSSFLQGITTEIQNLADSLASTNTEVANSTTEWVKLGYTASDSLDLAAASAIYARVGFTDVDTATTNLTSTIQAFKDSMSVGEDIGDFAEDIVDKFVNVGNTFASTAEGLGIALTDSASALVTAGNSLDEALALITAGNTITQDEAQVGAGLRTVSMRLRGTSASALIEAGEDTEGLITDAAKLYDTIKELTRTDATPEGISILTETGDFKSTYEILLDIARVWDDLNDQTRATLLETIAGKNRANIVASILQTKDDEGNPLLETAYEASLSSEGAAAEAMSITMDSVESAYNRMANAAQTLFQNSDMDRWLKMIYSMATGMLEFADSINLVESALGILAGTIAGFKISTEFQKTNKTLAEMGKELLSIGDFLKTGFSGIGVNLLGSLGGMVAGYIISQGLNLAILAIDDLVHAEERAVEASEDLKKTFSEANAQIQNNISTLEGYKDRFDELARGVSSSGENISLSTEEYQEYQKIVANIVEMQPSLAYGYDEETGYLIDRNSVLEEAIELEKQQIELEKVRQGNAENVSTLARGERSAYNQLMNESLSARDTFGWNLASILTEDLDMDQVLNLGERLSSFFDIDVAATYGTDISRLFSDYAFLIRDNYTSFLAYVKSLVNEEEQQEIMQSLVGLSEYETPEYSDAASKAYFEGVAASYSSVIEDVEVTEVADNFFDLFVEPFKDYSFDSSVARDAMDDTVAAVYDVLQDEGSGVKTAIQELFSLDLSDETYNEAVAIIQTYIDLILQALQDAGLDTTAISVALTPENIYSSMGYAREQNIEDQFNLRNTEITQAAEDQEAELQRITEYTANFTAEQKKLWNSATTGATTATEAIRAYEDALRGAELAQSDIIQSNAASIQTYQDQMSSIQEYLDKAADGSLTIGDVTTAVVELSLDSSQIDFNGDWVEDFVDLLENEAGAAWEEFEESLGDIDEPNLQGLVNQLREAHDEALAAAKAVDNLSQSLNTMASLSASLESISAAYDSLVQGEAISLDSLVELQESFGDLPSFENFIDSVAGATSVTNEIQNAFNQLTAEAVFNSEVIDQIIEQNGEYTETQRALLVTMLEQAGVTNSEAVANGILAQSVDELRAKKLLLQLATLDYSSAQEAQITSIYNEIAALLQEGTVSEATAQQLYNLVSAKIAVNGYVIDESGNIQALENLANAAVRARNALAESLGGIDIAEAAWTETAGGQRGLSAADQHRLDALNKINNTISSMQEVDFSDLMGVTPNMGGSGVASSGGGGGGAEETANEIDWISRKLELLEDNLSKLADKAADAYEPWIIRNQALDDEIEATIQLMEIQQNAYDEYMAKAEAVEIPDEYKQLIQEGGDFIEEIEDQDLYEAINQYKEYYDQAQDCKDQVDDLIHSVKELNSQKLDNLIEEYDDASGRINSMISLLQRDSDRNGTDNSALIGNLLKEQSQLLSEAEASSMEQLQENFASGIYGYAKGTWMMGNVAINTNQVDETLDATQAALDQLGFAVERTFTDMVTRTTELMNAAGEGTGIFVTFTPTLPDGQVITTETWKAYLNKISQGGTITSMEALLAADKQGAVVNGQQISNILLAAFTSASQVFQQAMSGMAGQINFGSGLSGLQASLEQYLRNNVFTSSFMESYSMGDVDIGSFVAEVVENYLDNSNFENSDEAEEAFDNSMSDVINMLFGSFIEAVADHFSEVDGDLEKLPELVEESPGYVEQFGTDMEKVAELGEDAADAAEEAIENIKKPYEHQLEMLDLQYAGATIENKGLVGGGVSLNEQVSLLEQQYDIQKQIYEAILMDIMANSEPGSPEYEAAEKALQELQNEMESIAAKIVEAILDDFNRVVEAYENALGLLEHRANMINLNMELADAQGYMASGVWYEYLIKNSEEELALLQQERDVLQEKLDAAVGSGYVEVYSEAWYEMQNQINEVDEAILQTTIDIQEFKNEIRQIEWDRFDYLQEKINTLNDEFEFLLQLIENSEDLIDDYGNLTDWGWTSISLYQSQFETYAHLVQNYRDEIAELDAEFANDSLNKDYIERRQELLEQEREYILAQQEAKNAIIDLIQDAYDQQLDKLQEIIDKKKESLQAEKDLYDYQQKVSDQTKNITDIQKQLSAYAGDDSEETQAKVQELKVDLQDAMTDLQNTEYDKYLSDQEEMMDRLYSDYEEWIDMRMDDTDALIEDVLAQLDEKGSVVEDCLTEITTTWNYDRLMESVESIEKWVQAMFDRADANAQYKSEQVWNNTVTQPLDTIYNGETIGSIIGSIGGGSGGGGGGSYGGSGGSGSSGNKDSVISNGPTGPLYENGHTSPSLFAPIYDNNTGDPGTYGPGDPEYDEMLHQLFNDGYSLEDSKDKFGDTEWYKYAEDFKNKHSYKEGGTLGKLVKYTGEDGIFFGRLGEEIVTPEELDKLSSIFEQVDLFKNLQAKYSGFPTPIMQSSTNMGDVNFEVVLPNVQNYEDFRRQLIRDPNFEKATLTMVNNAVVGKSSLGKMRYS